MQNCRTTWPASFHHFFGVHSWKYFLFLKIPYGSCFIFNQQYTHLISKLKYSFLNQVLNSHSVICNITTSNRKILNKKVCLFLRVLADHFLRVLADQLKTLRVFLSLYLPEYMAKSWHMFFFFFQFHFFFLLFFYLFFFFVFFVSGFFLSLFNFSFSNFSGRSFFFCQFFFISCHFVFSSKTKWNPRDWELTYSQNKTMMTEISMRSSIMLD